MADNFEPIGKVSAEWLRVIRDLRNAEPDNRVSAMSAVAAVERLTRRIDDLELALRAIRRETSLSNAQIIAAGALAYRDGSDDDALRERRRDMEQD